MNMKRGPKGPVNLEPLPWKSRAKVGTVEHFRLFCQRFLKVPRGVGALAPFKPRPWQLEAVRPFFEQSTKINLLCLPRGNGKSGLIAAVMIYRLFFGGEGSTGLVVAQNDASARRLISTVSRMLQLDDDLLERVNVYKDKVEYPGTDSSIVAVASEQAAVEGYDLTTAIIDELGFTERPVYEAVLLSLKRPGSKLLGIGTPSTPRMRDKSPFLDLVLSARAGDPDVSAVEYSAPEDAAVDDWDAIRAANPALGDFLDVETVKAQMPPKTSESEWRRARMGQWVTQTGESYMPADSWKQQARAGVEIPRGSKVVLALDGSQRWDATVLMMASVSARPHLQIAGFWFGEGDPDFEVSHAEVERRVMELSKQYRVMELTADPALWQRSLQVLDDQGIRTTVFPQHTSRMGKALVEFKAAVLDGQATHADDPRLNKHILAAQIRESGHGIKLAKPSKTQHIDAAVAATMCYSRAFWLGGKRSKKRVRSFKR